MQGHLCTKGPSWTEAKKTDTNVLAAIAAGDYDSAIDYLMTMGGVAREDSYEYLGQDDFCAPDFMAGSNKHSSALTRVKARPLPVSFAAERSLHLVCIGWTPGLLPGS